jgi:hypothetical protein
MAYNYFVARVNTTVRNMEAAANLLLDSLSDIRTSAPQRAAG